MSGKLFGKAALVTGGGRGIGRAIALALAGEGAAVCVMARTPQQIEAVAGEIRSLGATGIALACDVADAQSVDSMVDAAVGQLGRLDVLVHCAGGDPIRGELLEVAPDDWTRTVEINLLGAYHMARAAVPHLIATGGGKMILVGSGMGHAPAAGNSAYSVAKAGLWMLARCLALELWPHGIEVNELIPGPVYTDLTAELFDPSGDRPPPVAPSERVKRPEDVVPLAIYLATHPPGGPTGQSFSLARRPL